MTQHILMILPSTEDEKPRMVGPFLTEATANAWADREEIDAVRRMVRPLESPTSLYGYGRHALIPSPTPRKVMPTKPLEGADEGALRARRAAIVDVPTDQPERARRITITPEGALPLTGGIKHWVTGEALEAAPHNVLNAGGPVAHWSGSLARFGTKTTDGRVLELDGTSSGDWIKHFTRVPVGVWVMVPNVGALPIGLCERVRVEDGWLLGEGRVSIGHFQKAAPELLERAWPTGGRIAEPAETIPAAIDVTNGRHIAVDSVHSVGGGWELDRVVFGSVPAWPGCSIRFDHVEQGEIRP